MNRHQPASEGSGSAAGSTPSKGLSSCVILYRLLALLLILLILHLLLLLLLFLLLLPSPPPTATTSTTTTPATTTTATVAVVSWTLPFQALLTAWRTVFGQELELDSVVFLESLVESLAQPSTHFHILRPHTLNLQIIQRFLFA